jgi:hypothetical protein
LLGREGVLPLETTWRSLKKSNDVRVKASESEQIVAAMQQHGIPVTYVYYRDERHGLGRPENRRSFKAIAEAFLAAHLGGRREPVGDNFENSTIEFKVGRELIPPIGLRSERCVASAG